MSACSSLHVARRTLRTKVRRIFAARVRVFAVSRRLGSAIAIGVHRSSDVVLKAVAVPANQVSDPSSIVASMKPKQQLPPLPSWGGKRRGAGATSRTGRRSVPHRSRERFRNGALHATVRVRREVWNLRSDRCFRALRRAFERGCDRFGFRLIHFSVQGNHIHMIVEAPDANTLGRAMKGLEVRMARALNKVMRRRGAVFADRYHAHLLRSPSETARAVRYVLENWRIQAHRDERLIPEGSDPRSSEFWEAHSPPLVRPPRWWMLQVGIRIAERPKAA